MPDAATPEAPKKHRHIVVALTNLNKRKATLESQQEKITTELDEVNQAIAALE